MNQIASNVAHTFSNLHVSIPTVVGAGLGVAGVVWPEYQVKFTAVAAILVAYGIIGAANTPASSQTPPAPNAPIPAPKI